MIGQLCTEPAESLNQPQRPVGYLGELGRSECWMARNLSSVQLEAGGQKLCQPVDPECLWACLRGDQWGHLGSCYSDDVLRPI